MPWPPLVFLLVVSFFALYGGLLLCHAGKPVLYKVALAAFIPWLVTVVVIWIFEMFPMNDDNGLFWLWALILTVLGYLVIQFLLIWKFIGVKLSRVFLTMLAWLGLLVFCAGLVVLYVRFSENN